MKESCKQRLGKSQRAWQAPVQGIGNSLGPLKNHEIISLKSIFLPTKFIKGPLKVYRLLHFPWVSQVNWIPTWWILPISNFKMDLGPTLFGWCTECNAWFHDDKNQRRPPIKNVFIILWVRLREGEDTPPKIYLWICITQEKGAKKIPKGYQSHLNLLHVHILLDARFGFLNSTTSSNSKFDLLSRRPSNTKPEPQWNMKTEAISHSRQWKTRA